METCGNYHLLFHDWMINITACHLSTSFSCLFCCNKNLNVFSARIQLDHYESTSWVLRGKQFSVLSTNNLSVSLSCHFTHPFLQMRAASERLFALAPWPGIFARVPHVRGVEEGGLSYQPKTAAAPTWLQRETLRTQS